MRLRCAPKPVKRSSSEVLMRVAAALFSLFIFTLTLPMQAADWPFFRGPNRDGKSAEANLPLEWSKDKNIRWRVKLPAAGNSSPIVSGGKVFITCAQDKKGVGRSLYCFDRADGKELWVKT